METSSFKKVNLIIASIILLLAIFLLSVAVGSVKFPFKELINTLIERPDNVKTSILYDLRMPRAIIAMLVGANLAVSGALLQSVMRNPLADPGLTGISTGASFVAILLMLVFPQYYSILPIGAFLGGALACMMVFLLAWKNGIKPVRIILAGVAVNAILGGGTSLLSILHSDKIQGVLMWVNGSLVGKSWHHVGILLPHAIIGLGLSLTTIHSANLLQLGDDAATNLGINVNRTRILLSAVAVYLAGISVSVVGIIGFVGLVVPHIARLLIGSNYKFLLPFSMVLGATTLVFADMVARTIAAPIELPVGIIMAVVGGPFFLYLLRKGEK
ncbi:iron ABC transporter permease [Acidaminobacter sp. JC074]|uniref:FecCD family ABC transporter permease n=1 Tax=Acidaminobacter sp. JC074 TaxID=2530199 RepID=UPI001F0D3157|nr:iron ABC transporter permease [Acidaminobacter sp. JC074]MCH4891041.1 iron ABC transporter permease [Acidaminobacter sp. JC074]